MSEKLCLLVCSYFQREVAAAIEAEGWDDVVVGAFPADCGRPETGWGKLKRISSAHGEFSQVDAFGSPCIMNLANPPAGMENFQLHKIQQCFHLFADNDQIDDYILNGAYLITPGWLAGWQKHIKDMGFDEDTAPEFFNEFARQLVLLDTGVDKKTLRQIRELSNFVKLPFEVVPVGLVFLRQMLSKIVREWRSNPGKNLQERRSKLDKENWAGTERFDGALEGSFVALAGRHGDNS
jgi:hypothetical protein